MTPSELGDVIVRTRALVDRLHCVVSGSPLPSGTAIQQELAELDQKLAGMANRVQTATMRTAQRTAHVLERMRRVDRELWLRSGE